MSTSFANVIANTKPVMAKANIAQRKLVYTDSADAWEGYYCLGVGGCCVDAFPPMGADGWTPINKSAVAIAAYLTAKSGDQTSV